MDGILPLLSDSTLLSAVIFSCSSSDCEVSRGNAEFDESSKSDVRMHSTDLEYSFMGFIFPCLTLKLPDWGIRFKLEVLASGVTQAALDLDMAATRRICEVT